LKSGIGRIIINKFFNYRLLDMGFEKDIVAIVEALSEKKPFVLL
jgi:superfamily II DNA/RNA helicase